jgi:alpha-tubulin suppressor-like RCC1 family protein
VFCWGQGGTGQLGDGTTTDSTTPVRVIGLTNATQVAAGRDHSCGIRPNGRTWCWGWNGNGQLGDGTTTDRLTAVRVVD